MSLLIYAKLTECGRDNWSMGMQLPYCLHSGNTGVACPIPASSGSIRHWYHTVFLLPILQPTKWLCCCIDFWPDMAGLESSLEMRYFILESDHTCSTCTHSILVRMSGGIFYWKAKSSNRNRALFRSHDLCWSISPVPAFFQDNLPGTIVYTMTNQGPQRIIRCWWQNLWLGPYFWMTIGYASVSTASMPLSVHMTPCGQ